MTGLDKPAATGAAAVRRWLPLAVLVAGLVLFFALGWNRYVSFEELHKHHDQLRRFVDAHGFLAAVSYISVYVVMTAFSLPGGTVMTVLGGYLFGSYIATVYVVIGATAGATVLFCIARSTLGAFLKAKAGPFLHKMKAGFQENALSYLLVLRLVPLFPFWLVNLVPAFLGVRLRTYAIGTFFGIIPGTFVYALLGGGVGEVLDTGRKPDLDIIFRSEILLPLVGLAILALLPVVYKAVKARRR
jgi:uncharacterized membrane protein YdjX (TVP38/TMEM64 family)